MSRRPAEAFELPAVAAHAALLPSPAGLPLGRTRDRQLLQAELFAEHPGRLGAVLTVPDLAVLLGRVLDSGAQVVVASSRPGLWSAVAAALAPTHGRLEVHAPYVDPPYADPPVRASLVHPLLVVRDSHLVTPPKRIPPGPWRTDLVLLPELLPVTAPAIRSSDGYLFRRLADQEASLASRALGLPGPAADVLAAVPDGQFAVLFGDDLHLVDRALSEHEEARRRAVTQAVAAAAPLAVPPPPRAGGSGAPGQHQPPSPRT
jgi:hypothetical protein